ncbi:MAG: hypothetical protein NVSMB32_15440 [Actinomycetota bacterium]
MGSQEDLERLREKGDKAGDYFSKIPGFEQAQWRPAAEEPAQEEPAAETPPAAPAKPEPPLSEAEKYFTKILG